jgi:hypothetical protein
MMFRIDSRPGAEGEVVFKRDYRARADRLIALLRQDFREMIMSIQSGRSAMSADMGVQRQQTLGEHRVGITFNPGGDKRVDEIKHAAADLIDLINATAVDRLDDGEVMRLKALAMTAIEDGAMWAVKAVTKPSR